MVREGGPEILLSNRWVHLTEEPLIDMEGYAQLCLGHIYWLSMLHFSALTCLALARMRTG